MSAPRLIVLTAALVLLGSSASAAQAIIVSGNPGLLRISTAVAGTEPTSVTDATTTYTVNTTSTQEKPFKVTAQLSANMPPSVFLAASLAAPPQATSLGFVDLDVTARDMVLNIKKNVVSTQGITYQLRANVAAGVVPSSSRTVTLTIIAQP